MAKGRNPELAPLRSQLSYDASPRTCTAEERPASNSVLLLGSLIWWAQSSHQHSSTGVDGVYSKPPNTDTILLLPSVRGCACMNGCIHAHTFIPACMHACMHAVYIHDTYIHLYIHTYVRTYKSSMHTYVRTYIHTYTHAHVLTFIYIHTHIHTYMHKYRHAHMQRYIHTYRRTNIHACIQSYILTYLLACIRTCIHTLHCCTRYNLARQLS